MKIVNEPSETFTTFWTLNPLGIKSCFYNWVLLEGSELTPGIPMYVVLFSSIPSGDTQLFLVLPHKCKLKLGTLELMIQMRDEYGICFSLLLKLGYFLWDYIKTILKIVSIGTSAPWVIHWKSVLNNLFLKCVFLICGDKLLVSRMECPVGIRVDRFVWSQQNFDVVCSKN